jgi:ABC-type polysaccharide transport system permease subunit
MDISEDRVMLHLISKSPWIPLQPVRVLYASPVINDVTNATVSQELLFLVVLSLGQLTVTAPLKLKGTLHSVT